MDYPHSTTTEAIRKSGKHLTLDERGQIQALHREGFSLRAIAARIGCSHTTIHYEITRGTPERRSARGRSPQYIRQNEGSRLTLRIERTPNDHTRLTARSVLHSCVG